MPSKLSRKEFFRQVGRELRFFAGELRQALEPQDMVIPDPLMSDFTPELLAEEARRLGLDPHCEADDLMRAIRRRMLEGVQG